MRFLFFCVFTAATFNLTHTASSQDAISSQELGPPPGPAGERIGPSGNRLKAASIPNPSAPLPAGIIGWWPGDENGDDLIGIHHGVMNNGVSLAPGLVGSAFRFDGIDDFVDLGRWNAGSAWTLEAWVNPSALPARRRGIFGGIAESRDWALVMRDGQLGVDYRRLIL